MPRPDTDFVASSRNLEDRSTGASGAIRRYLQNVIVREEVTPQQIEDIARFLVQEMKSDRDFNSFVMWFWDHEVFMDSGGMVSLGIATYAPGGDVGRDLDFRAGDYSTHRLDFNIWEKDWSTRPTDDEIVIFGRIVERVGSTDPDAIVANRSWMTTIAETNDLTIEELEDIVLRSSRWQGQRIR